MTTLALPELIEVALPPYLPPESEKPANPPSASVFTESGVDDGGFGLPRGDPHSAHHGLVVDVERRPHVCLRMQMMQYLGLHRQLRAQRHLTLPPAPRGSLTSG